MAKAEYTSFDRNAPGMDEVIQSHLMNVEQASGAPIEYAQLEDGKWCVRLVASGATKNLPQAAIANTLGKAAIRFSMLMCLRPT